MVYPFVQIAVSCPFSPFVALYLCSRESGIDLELSPFCSNYKDSFVTPIAPFSSPLSPD